MTYKTIFVIFFLLFFIAGCQTATFEEKYEQSPQKIKQSPGEEYILIIEQNGKIKEIPFNLQIGSE